MRDLDALLAELTETGNLESLTPANLAEMLRTLGVGVGNEEATSLNVVASRQNAPPGRAGSVRLDAMLEHMNADQLKQVAKRFNASANAGRMVESKKAVLQALSKTSLLDKMIADLSPLERVLLSEVKRRGGVADGWALIVHAALHGLELVERPGISVYKNHLGHAPGIGYLGVLLRDGLLIPAGNHASWFATSHYYASEHGADDDLVFVDSRILARLPDEPSPLLPTLELEPLNAVTPTSHHPLQTLLELFDVMQLVLEEGGLQITQSGAANKRVLSRLIKRRPWLEPRLERLLRLSLALGLLDAPESGSTKDPWRVNLLRLRKLQDAPLVISYSFMVEAFLSVAEISDDDPWGMRYSDLISETVAGQALLESLAVLPDYPVPMEGALEGLWQRALKHVLSPRTQHWKANHATKPERPTWFTDMLLGAFRDLGLVTVAELSDVAAKPVADKPARGGLHVMRGDKVARFMSPSESDTAYRYAVMPALGLTWLAQGQRLQRAKQPPDVKQFRQLLGLDPDTGKPNEPSLLIQPNFDILVYLNRFSPLALTALSCTDCTRVDAQTASYTVTRSSLYRALEAGLELDTLLKLLQEHSMGVPDNVARSLRDWASRRERLHVQEGVKLLEYASQDERDAALNTFKGARAVAERFLLLKTVPEQLKVNVRHQYNLAPARTLRFHSEGHFQLEGATDLAGRAVLAQVATQDLDGTYHLDVAAIRAGTLNTAARDTLTARARGGLPPQLEALMNIWEGRSAAPALAKISVFQHPSAVALVKHPGIAQYLEQQLNDTSYLVKEGHEKGLEQRLSDLGVKLSEGFVPHIKPQAIQSSIMQNGLDTRKMRVMIQATIGEGRSLELRYHQEKESYDRYGYTKKSKGKLVTEKVTPESVEYSGSTPYLTGKTLGKSAHRYIRIGYITEIAVL